jgi:hypothetical protein
MGSQKDSQNSSLLNSISLKYKTYWKLLILVSIVIILLIIYFDIDLITTIGSKIIQWFEDNWKDLSHITAGGILGGIIAAFIFTHLYEKQFWDQKFKELKEVNRDAAEKYEELANNYKELSEKNDALLKKLPEAIGGPFTKSLFKYPAVVSNELAEILGKLTDEWYQQYHKRVLVSKAEDTYKIVRVNKIENAGRGMEEDSMEVWELEFLSTWTWSNDSEVVKYPLRDFMVAVTAPDVAIENLLEGSTSSIIERKRKEFFSFIRSKNIVRSIILHKDVMQELSEQAIPQMISIKEFGIDWGDVGRFDSIKFENFENVEEIPRGVYNAYKLPDDHANKPLEPKQSVAITYRGMISIPVINESNNRMGKLFLPFPDLIAEQYILTLNYPKNVKLEGIDKSVKIVEDKSGIWFGYERLTQPRSLVEGDSPIPTEFRPENGEDAMRLKSYGPLTDLNYSIMYWEEAN